MCVLLRGGGGGVVQAYHFGIMTFRILGSTFFGDLNQKSATIIICEVHIYIDSERFRQIH